MWNTYTDVGHLHRCGTLTQMWDTNTDVEHIQEDDVKVKVEVEV